MLLKLRFNRAEPRPREETMQFTKAEEYGVFGVMYLAGAADNRIVPLSEISEVQDIPEKFLAKIFQSLSRSGIVQSHRGVRGGFTMARDPNELTIREVLETIQGPFQLMKCVDDISQCDRSVSFCAFREVIAMAERRLVSVLEEYTIGDLLNWEKTGIKPSR